ncbi:MAG TPA: DUF4159 domain-containing protein [Myxococcales bacterium]|nr:DUF4159 domain-containing protein [Myxococcales bacterium]
MRARFSRRALLLAGLAGAAGAVLPRRARAFGEASRLSFALLRHGGRWDTRPDALPRLAWEVARRTSIDTTPTVRSLGAADPELFRHPFAVLASDAAVPALGEAEAAGLRRYLSYGGFLLVDDASGVRGGGFDASVRELLRRVLPGAALTPVPRDHVLYKSFYLLDGPAGRVSAAPDLLGLELGGRLGVLYSQNDLLGALARDAFGAWEMEVTPGGEMQREKAIRLGVNTAMYAMCLDYKEDQVHIPFILKRRRI